MLEKVYALKDNVESYVDYGDREDYKFSTEIRKSFDDFKKFNTINKAYLSSNMLQNLNEYKSRLEGIFYNAASFYDNKENIATTNEATRKQRLEAKKMLRKN